METSSVVQLLSSLKKSSHPPLYQVVRCHSTQTSSWLPPSDSWDAKRAGLPYGWEIAVDKDSKQYFINHLNKTTTYEDPRKELIEDAPKPREVELIRHPEMGFGFVAGSEKPVIVRFVTDGGPSHGKLLPGDQILKVNGEDVKKAPRDHAIDLVKACKHSVILTVCQPETDSSFRKSALLSAAKKARLKSNPSRVRFAEGVVINGSPLFSPSNYSAESCIPFMPNVLKVFLENGQTRSFKYDNSTLVQDVLESLQQKLSIKCIEHFSLVVEHIKSLRRNKLTLLDPKECLAKVAARPGAQHLRCLFRVTFVPKDSYDLLKEDPVTFEYLYTQCCNDVVQERFAPELKYDIALRLAALHMQQHFLSNVSSSSLSLSTSTQTKLSVKTIERECGLENFVPISLTETMKRKELRKLLSHFLKLNQGLSAPGQKTLTAVQAKLHYLRIISELPSYGAKCFTTNLRDSNMETVILVSPKFGVSQIAGMRNAMPVTLANIEDLSAIVINREDELSHHVELQMKDLDKENILLSLEDRDSEELVLILQGYYRLLTNRPLTVQQEKDRWAEDGAPAYHSKHSVQEAGWNYVESATSTNNSSETMDASQYPNNEHSLDLTLNPPSYHTNKSVTANGHVNTGTMGQSKQQASGYADNNSGEMKNLAAASHLDHNVLMTVDKNMNRTLSFASNVRASSESNGVSKAAAASPSAALTSQIAIISSPSPIAKQNSANGIEGKIGGNSARLMLPAVSPQFQHVLQMEIRDGASSAAAKAPASPRIESKQTLENEVEVPKLQGLQNADVVKRVAEMQQIVLDAEMYLTEEEFTDTDLDSSRGESTLGDLQDDPPLKAADSLLLLNQIGRENDIEEAVKNLQTSTDHEPSESDTDSMSTPTDSPSHRPTVERRLLRPHHPPVARSGSSFGLHSPDNFHKDGRLEKTNLQELFQKLQQSQLPYPFAEGTLYLDPDIIDLTMIPPPITPDHEEAPSAVSFPPTPFADRQTLEAELAHGLIPLNHASCSKVTLNLLHNNIYALARRNNLNRNIQCGNNGTAVSGEGGAEWVANEDIDMFIASVAVPPPPPTAAIEQTELFGFKELRDVVELTQEEISAYIIPPPPASSSSDSETEIISRLQSAAASVEKIVKNRETDKKMDDGRDHPQMVTLNVCYDAHGNYGGILSTDNKGDSSGYETYSSSAVSSMELKPNHRRALNNSFSDNSSTISCSSSSTNTTATELAGTQADTEDNIMDTEDYHHCSPNPLLNLPSKANGTRTLTGNCTQLSNGFLKAGRPAIRCNSSSSDDGASNCNNNTNSSPRRTGIPCHQGISMTLSRKNSRPSAAARLNGNSRSSSNDNLTKSGSCDSPNTENLFAFTVPVKSVGGSNQQQWSSSSESLATAAALAANDKRTNGGGATPKSPPSPSSNVCRSSPSRKIITKTAVNEDVNKFAQKSNPVIGLKQGQHLNNGNKPQTFTSATTQVEDLLLEEELGQSKVVDGFLNDSQSLAICRRRSSSLKLSNRKITSSESMLSENNSLKLKHITRSRLLPNSNGNINNSKTNYEPNGLNKSLFPSKLPRGSIGNRHIELNKSDLHHLSTSHKLPVSSSTSLFKQKMSYNNSCCSRSSFENKSVTMCESASRNLSCHRDRRDSFYGAEEAIGNMLLRLDDVLSHCAKGVQIGLHAPYGSRENKEKVNLAKDALVIASKQFVTASKLFVKGATESEERLVECLIQCLGLLDQMFGTTERLALTSSVPLQTHDLVLKVKDVAFTFLQTLQAASDAVGKNMSNPSVNLLMQQATTLAAVLTALMRTLKVFNPCN